MKQHVLAYSEAIIRFTDVNYRRIITMCGVGRMFRSNHLCLAKNVWEKSAWKRVQ